MKKIILILSLLIITILSSYSQIKIKTFVKNNTEITIGIGILGSCFILNEFVCKTDKQRQTVYLTGMVSVISINYYFDRPKKKHYKLIKL